MNYLASLLFFVSSLASAATVEETIFSSAEGLFNNEARAIKVADVPPSNPKQYALRCVKRTISYGKTTYHIEERNRGSLQRLDDPVVNVPYVQFRFFENGPMSFDDYKMTDLASGELGREERFPPDQYVRRVLVRKGTTKAAPIKDFWIVSHYFGVVKTGNRQTQQYCWYTE